MEVAAETPAACRARRRVEIRRLVEKELAAVNGHRPTGKR
jgi:hypothetical protein